MGRALSESMRGNAVQTDGTPVFLEAGQAAEGEFHCSACGYGVAVRNLLPVCPMCRGLMWEPLASSPYARSRV